MVGVVVPAATTAALRPPKVAGVTPTPLTATLASTVAPTGSDEASMRILPRSTVEEENETSVSPVKVIALLPAL